MGFWSKLFGAKTSTRNLTGGSPYLTPKKDPIDISFATKFTQKGGKFIYSEDAKTSDEYFKLILEENHWKNEEILCFDQNLTDRFHLPIQSIDVDTSQFKVFLIRCEYLIANKGTILICNHQLMEVEDKNQSLGSFRVGQSAFYIPLNEEVDQEEERKKLTQELTYAKGFLKSVEKKLANERFVSNAPEKVIELERKKAADAKEKIALLEKSLGDC